MRISRLLADKGDSVATVAPDATVGDVVAELARLGIGALIVSADGRHIDGIISERDVVRRLAAAPEAITSEPVTALMSSHVHTCSPDDDVEGVMTVMTERRIRHLPVVVDGELHGLVSIGDVVKSRIGELEKDRQELVEYITAR